MRRPIWLCGGSARHACALAWRRSPEAASRSRTSALVNGTYLNGKRLDGESRPLEQGDSIGIGDQTLRFLGGQETRIASRELPLVGIQKVIFEGARLSIGRDPANDVVLDDPNVSRFHAEVLRDGDAVRLTDLGSRNGTRLNGELTNEGTIETGAEIGIGPYRLVFDGDSFLARDDHGALRLDAMGCRDGGGGQAHPRADLAFDRARRAGCDHRRERRRQDDAAQGACRRDARDGRTDHAQRRGLFARLTDVGYVPQDDIVHRLLTVREALGYAARLRLPQDVSDEEIDAAVERVLEELSLGAHAETMIGSLSGGQRKRAGVATELLSRPSVLFLDEPTTGLDPGLETADDGALREPRDDCTRGRGRHARDQEPPALRQGGGDGPRRRADLLRPAAGAVEFFGVSDYDGIYTALETAAGIRVAIPVRAAERGRRWRRRVARSRGPTRRSGGAGPVSRASARRGRRLLPQVAILTRRNAKLMLRDRRNMLLLLGQIPILALLDAFLFQSGIFDRPGGARRMRSAAVPARDRCDLARIDRLLPRDREGT